MDISIIVPLFNEEESIPELCAWIQRVTTAHSLSYEVILIDDGSTDSSWEIVEKLSVANASVKGIKFQRNYGKSAALNEGFRVCQGDVVITMDADLQDSPEEIPGLRDMIINQGFDIVSGWKQKRHDPLEKRLPSKFFNWITAKISRIPLHDFNCGLKAYRSKVVKSIEVYGEMHRYIPLIAKWSGFRKVGEKVVQHHARKYGTSKFGFERYINGFLDLATIMFLGKFGKRPMQFFGFWGTLLSVIGFGIFSYLTVSKFFFDETGLTQRPLFFVALVIMIIGSQLFLTGFISELVARNAPGRNHYLIEKKLGLND
ncbi:MAG: glycosyltransferase [Chitinophagaceae bacterium]|nr:glycosyltransferase [Chitinophagaceae bacterium]